MKRLIVSLMMICFLLGEVIPPITAYAETGDAGQAARYLRIGVGARALGMGGAFVSVCDDASATYWNPAGLTQLTQREITSMTSLMSLDRSYNFLNYVTPQQDNTLGISVINFGVKDLREFVETNQVDVELGKFDDTENTLMLSIARPLNDKLSLGVNLKYLTQQMNPSQTKKASGSGIDLGTLYKLSDNFKVGLMLQDVYSYLKWDTGWTDRLPLNLKLGISGKFLDDRLILATDVHRVEDNHKTKIYAGAEYWLRRYDLSKENLGLRAGVFDTEITAGLSFIFPIKTFKSRLDYSFAPDRFSDFKDDISSSERYNHRFSLSVKF